VKILHNFGIASGLEINWHKSVPNHYNRKNPP
jgi:hypothetical protein